MFKKFLLAILVLLQLSGLEAGIATEQVSPIITHVSTEDMRTIKLRLEDNDLLYCVAESHEVIYAHEKNEFLLQLCPAGKTYTYTNFKFFRQSSDLYIGEITFRHSPTELQRNKGEYVTLAKNSFSFPPVQNTSRKLVLKSLSEKEKMRLINKIENWNPEALEVIFSPARETLERCSLIIQYLWSIDPLIGFASDEIHRMGLIEWLDALEEKQEALICGTFANLFVEVVAVLMPDVKIRRVDGYECYYPSIYENIHVNSHAFAEVHDKTRWVYIDPYFQVYMHNELGTRLNSQEVKKSIELGNLSNLIPIQFPVKPPDNFYWDRTCYDDFGRIYYDPLQTLERFGFFRCFGWLDFIHIVVD